MKFTTASEAERDAIIRDILATVPPPKLDKREEGLRILVTGKGGVGKTVIASLLAHSYARMGKKILAVDEDPQMNLPYALGLSEQVVEKIIPLNRQLDYIEEKTGARPGTGWGLFIRLNPEVDDVISRFGININEHISLLVMGTVVQAAVGCVCPENDLLEAVMNYIVLKRNEIIIMDTEAGLEHFGRAVSRGYHHAIIVSEPSFNSILVALQAAKLATHLKIPYIHLLFNKVRNNTELTRALKIVQSYKDNTLFQSINFLPYENKFYEYEPTVVPILNMGKSPFTQAFYEFFEKLNNF